MYKNKQLLPNAVAVFHISTLRKQKACEKNPVHMLLIVK